MNILQVQKMIFLKYNDYYVYFKNYYLLEKELKIYIFLKFQKDVVETIIGEKHIFKIIDGMLLNVKIIDKPKDLNINDSKIRNKIWKIFTYFRWF